MISSSSNYLESSWFAGEFMDDFFDDSYDDGRFKLIRDSLKDTLTEIVLTVTMGTGGQGTLKSISTVLNTEFLLHTVTVKF